MNDNLAKKYTNLPTDDECKYISKTFEDICGIPRIVCCIDGTHVPILPPLEGYRDLKNRKGWASLVTQLVRDDRLI